MALALWMRFTAAAWTASALMDQLGWHPSEFPHVDLMPALYVVNRLDREPRNPEAILSQAFAPDLPLLERYNRICCGMPTQLRMYVIDRGRPDAFVAAWKKGVYPLRRQQGFVIDAAWTIPERNTFVWLLSYDGPEDWQAKEAAYYGSAERAALDPDPARWIAQNNTWFVDAVDLDGPQATG